ncbi:MAG TPA: folylpolyglutamate synthase/dihydrofolate synthase family protein [Chloroflexia bacterium]|nr:folylpolyglutamate synthase/dihydrofolate synthase family protein [Chloroflexia bacterium]
MRYQEAYDYINSFTNYEQVPGYNADLSADGLERVRLLLRLLGRPQNSFKSIVVAGTKGKGSVAAMLESVLRTAGYRTGLYTSPHLHTFRERIRISGALIPPGDMSRLTSQIQPVVERIKLLGDPSLVPTTYELTTALAFLYFQYTGVQYAVLEVGLGGRLDAVNVVTPLVSVITSISLDHTQVLGDTLAKIAREKAGIIKPGVWVVSAPQADEAARVVARVAAQQRARLVVIGREIYVGTGQLPEVVSDDEGIPVYQAFLIGFEDARGIPTSQFRVRLPLLGSHQQLNAAVTIGALRVLQNGGIEIPRAAILDGLSEVEWPGRLEVIHRNPVVVADGAHNVESIGKLGQAVADIFPKRPVIVVLGVSRDKDIAGILAELRGWTDGFSGPTVERLIVTRSNHPRSADPRSIAEQAVAAGFTVELREDVRSALTRADAAARALARSTQSDPIVLATGSLFVVAEAREAYGLGPDLSEETAEDKHPHGE